MDLEPSVVKDHVKKYVLHLIFEEAASLSEADMKLIRAYCDEPLVNSTIGEIFEQVQNELFFVESDSFQQYLMNVIDTQNNIKNSFKKANDYYSDLIFPFHERTRTMFPYYFKYFVNKKRPIKPQSLDKDGSKEFYSDLLVHFNQFKGLLSEYSNKINPTREILEFERETNIFFILKVHSILPQEKLSKMSSKRKDNYFRAIAVMTLVEDIRLKLYFVEQFIAEDNDFLFTKSHDGYNRLFWLIFFYIPLLKDFIKNQIKAPKGTLTVKDPFLDDKEEAKQLRRIKKKLFLCNTLKNIPCYPVTDLKGDYIFEVDKFECSDNFDDLYKNINKLKKFREMFSEETIEKTVKSIYKTDCSSEYFEYLFDEQVKSLVTEMSFTFDEDIHFFELDEKYFNEQKILNKLKQLNGKNLSEYK